MKFFNSYYYYYYWYSYLISPYQIFSLHSTLLTKYAGVLNEERCNENKRIIFVPFTNVIRIKNSNCLPKYNISDTDIQKFIQRIKKYEFPKEMKIPLEDY